MASPASVAVPVARKSLLAYAVAFTVHTLVAYNCALHLSQLVFHWFGWIAPPLHSTISIPATDWYLQHFELVTSIPALVIGYVNVVRFFPAVAREYLHETRIGSVAFWTWTVPTLVLLYRMLQYHAPSSVLYGSSMTAMRYFFDIQKVMPTVSNPLASDPERVWAQMSVTAPFYAGLAYSLGVLASKHSLVTKLFVFEKKDESTPTPEL